MVITYNYCITYFKKLIFRNPTRMDNYDFFWPNGICIPGMRSLFVTYNGQYYPCESIYDHYPFSIGNIETNGLEIKKIADLINRYCEKTAPMCESCWAYRLCDSCFTSAMSVTDGKYSISKKKAACANIKRGILDTFKDYFKIINKNPHAFDYLSIKDKPVTYNNMSSDI